MLNERDDYKYDRVSVTRLPNEAKTPSFGYPKSMMFVRWNEWGGERMYILSLCLCRPKRLLIRQKWRESSAQRDHGRAYITNHFVISSSESCVRVVIMAQSSVEMQMGEGIWLGLEVDLKNTKRG